MMDGIAEIPLPRSISEPSAAHDGGVALSPFFVGPENRLVEAVVRAVLEGEVGDYNPLVLHGPSGTGKSHLAQGLAAAWKTRHRRRRDQGAPGQGCEPGDGDGRG